MANLDMVASGEVIDYDTDAVDSGYGDEGQRPDRQGPDLLAFYIEQPNITEHLTTDQINDIGSEALQGYEEDYQSEADWRNNVEEVRKIISQEQEDKVYPWPKASNIKYPLILTAGLQFNARSMPVILNDGDIALGKITGSDEGIPLIDPDTQQPAQHPQTGEVVMEVQPGAKKARADRVAKHLSWQLLEEMDGWEEDTDRLTLAIAYDGSAFKKIYFDEETGKNASDFIVATDLIVNNATKDLKSCPRISHITAYYPHEIIEKINLGLYRDPDIGLFDDERDRDPIDVIEQHTLIDLDDDGYPEPYIVTFHKETGKIFRIIANFTTDDMLLGPDEEDGTPVIARITKRDYFVHYYCFPDPSGGFKGKGFGQLLLPISNSIDSILNLLVDAGHLSNTGGGFLGASFRTQSGAVRFTPGEWKKVDVRGMALKDAVLPLPVRDPSPVLFSLLGFLVDTGKEVASTQDVMTGGGSPDAAVGTTMANIEQGMKVYTSIIKRIYRSLKEELKLLYKLNSQFLPDEQYFQVMDQPEAIAREDYNEGDFDIVPAADPNMATDIQKALKAQAVQQFFGTPVANSAEIMVEVLTANGVDDAQRFVAPPPPPGPTPEQLEKMAELNIKKQEADNDSMKVLTDSLLKIQQAEELGGDAVIGVQEYALILEIAKKTGIIDDQGNEEAVSGVEGNPLA